VSYYLDLNHLPDDLKLLRLPSVFQFWLMVDYMPMKKLLPIVLLIFSFFPWEHKSPPKPFAG